MSMPAKLMVFIFQSTHPVRGATVGHAEVHERLVISIHAPREGCDVPVYMLPKAPTDFNPRTP